MKKEFLIQLVAEAKAKTPTGYHASFHSPDSVVPFPSDLLTAGNYACNDFAQDIVIAKKNSPEAGVTNMICSYLTGESFYSDVVFLAFDPETRTLTLPTLKQLSRIMTLACIKFDESIPGNVAFTDEDDYPDEEEENLDDCDPDFFCQDFEPSSVSSERLDIKEALVLD